MQENRVVGIVGRFKRIWGFMAYDPRHYQIAILSTLIAVGVSQFGFHLPLWHAVSCIGSALFIQFIGDKFLKRNLDIRSPLITSLSLTLLLRTGSVWLSLLAGVLSIGSKYLIRVRGKHIFNPANFGIVVVALLFTSAWVSPGQWGVAPLMALLIVGLGGLVTSKAKSWDISLAFFGFYAALVVSRALWLGDPLTIPAHQLQSGAILIFAFFMISDPKTSPNARVGRVVYALLVASLGFSLQTFMYHSAGVIYALVFTAPLAPLFDKFFKARAYQWPIYTQPLKGVSHDQNIETS